MEEENVRNFVSFNKEQTFRLALASLLEMGYQARFGILDAGAFGVSQSRKHGVLQLVPLSVRILLETQLSDYQLLEMVLLLLQSCLKRISYQENDMSCILCLGAKNSQTSWRDLPEEKLKLSTGQMVDLIPWCLLNTAKRHNQWKGLFGRLDWEGNFSTSITDPQPIMQLVLAQLRTLLLIINRVLNFIAKPGLGDGKGSGYSSIIPDAPGADSHSLCKEFAKKIGDYVYKYVKATEKGNTTFSGESKGMQSQRAACKEEAGLETAKLRSEKEVQEREQHAQVEAQKNLEENLQQFSFAFFE
ncbi:DNA (cytosine-5)-methyltransferase 1B-like protein [Tanacetum coccineum]